MVYIHVSTPHLGCERELDYRRKDDRDEMFMLFLDPIGKEREVLLKYVQPRKFCWNNPPEVFIVAFLP